MIKRLGFALLLLLGSPAVAQQQTDADKQTQAQEAGIRLHQDWAWLDRYRVANGRLPPAASSPRVVFIGDSITQGWFDMMPGFFAGERVNRGIGGQTTPQMLLRFRQDVIDLHPAVVQIMGGTNDIASNTGPMTPEQTQENIMSMVELAHAHGIRVILASIPPAANFPWRPGLETAQKIVAVNTWLKGYAGRVGATYADYWTALRQGLGMQPRFTSDGVHPNKAGYAAMAPTAEAAIRAVLATPAPQATAR